MNFFFFLPQEAVLYNLGNYTTIHKKNLVHNSLYTLTPVFQEKTSAQDNLPFFSSSRSSKEERRVDLRNSSVCKKLQKDKLGWGCQSSPLGSSATRYFIIRAMAHQTIRKQAQTQDSQGWEQNSAESCHIPEKKQIMLLLLEVVRVEAIWH